MKDSDNKKDKNKGYVPGPFGLDSKKVDAMERKYSKKTLGVVFAAAAVVVGLAVSTWCLLNNSEAESPKVNHDQTNLKILPTSIVKASADGDKIGTFIQSHDDQVAFLTEQYNEECAKTKQPANTGSVALDAVSEISHKANCNDIQAAVARDMRAMGHVIKFN